MPIFGIADLHLALGADKPMDIFGGRWEGYMEKLRANWTAAVGRDDLVVIPGDVSWATYLTASLPDFRFISALPGKKLISKGNHDYWWTTMSKLRAFLDENALVDIEFMHNNSYVYEETVICGTRGWKCPGDADFGPEDRKIFLRELQRLELSLKSACGGQMAGREGEAAGNRKRIVAAMHFPPFNPDREPSEFVSIMKRYGVEMCLYGHLHGEGGKNAVEGKYEGIEFRFIAADHLHFAPIRLF